MARTACQQLAAGLPCEGAQDGEFLGEILSHI